MPLGERFSAGEKKRFFGNQFYGINKDVCINFSKLNFVTNFLGYRYAYFYKKKKSLLFLALEMKYMYA